MESLTKVKKLASETLYTRQQDKLGCLPFVVSL